MNFDIGQTYVFFLIWGDVTKIFGIFPNPHRMFFIFRNILFFLSGTLPDNIYIYIYIYIYTHKKSYCFFERERERERERESSYVSCYVSNYVSNYVNEKLRIGEGI